jgi:hypothetical protein
MACFTTIKSEWWKRILKKKGNNQLCYWGCCKLDVTLYAPLFFLIIFSSYHNNGGYVYL